MRAFLLIPAFLIPVLSAQVSAPEAQVRYIPALAYGPQVWSILRLSNSSDSARTIHIEVFRENGERLPIGPEFEVGPHATRDVRVDGGTSTPEMGWARVLEASGSTVKVQALVEILEGNAIEDFPREMHDASDRKRWVALASNMERKQLYFLNVADQATVVSFCAGDKAAADACLKKGTPTARYIVKPNQCISVQIHKVRRKFFITESSAPGAAVLVLFGDGGGTKQVFGSSSSVQFGEALP